MVVQRGPRQPRGDHSLFHEGKRHLLQTGPWLCPQLPGDHLHETHLLWQLLRICKSQHKLNGCCVIFWGLFAFDIRWCFSPPPHIRYHSCGVSSSKATDAKVIMALHRVHIYRLPNVSQYRVKMKCHAASCGEQVKHSYVEKVHCGFLCCTLLAETLQHIKKKQKNNTHKKNQTAARTTVFPPPPSLKRPESYLFPWQ